MSTLWSGFIGVVLGGLISGVGAWFGARTIARHTATAARLERRAQAYADFLTTCGLIVFTADSLRSLVVQRSGIEEGALVTTGGRPAFTPEQAIDFFKRDLDPLYTAWSNVWTVGSQEAIALANDILDLAGKLLRTSSEGGKARGPVASALLGHAFSDAQQAQFKADTSELAGLRRDFGMLARREGGEPVARLFTSPAA